LRGTRGSALVLVLVVGIDLVRVAQGPQALGGPAGGRRRADSVGPQPCQRRHRAVQRRRAPAGRRASGGRGEVHRMHDLHCDPRTRRIERGIHRPHTACPEPADNTVGTYTAGVTRLSRLKTAGHKSSSNVISGTK
jgi:hypothetical protein